MAITKILNINAAKSGNPAAHLEHAIGYIQNPDKTDEKVLVGSINCLPDTAFLHLIRESTMEKSIVCGWWSRSVFRLVRHIMLRNCRDFTGCRKNIFLVCAPWARSNG